MKRYFFLDFDGVLCDSIPECFVSSSRAYYELHLGETIRSVSLRDKALFYSLRPFIRTGEDFVLIQDIMRRKAAIGSQEDFDREIELAGEETMTRYRRLIYQVREDFLKNDKEFWLDLNPLFPGMAKLLARELNNKNVFILSTKKPPFIREILMKSGIDWSIERILDPMEKTKKEVMESLMDGNDEAAFVDDQLDTLLIAAGGKNIRGRLATWGYVKEPWLKQKTIPLLRMDQLGGLIREFFGE